jgi:hypothetical protein
MKSWTRPVIVEIQVGNDLPSSSLIARRSLIETPVSLWHCGIG